MTSFTSELALTFVAGLLGSSHCVGMCGGFAMMLGLTSSGRWRGARRQLAYSGGRIFTYSVLGAIAGFIGQRLTTLNLVGVAARVGAGLCILAGLFLIVEGLKAAGYSWRAQQVGRTPTAGCLSAPLLSTFLRARGLHNAFLAGVLTGFLPCGLVYAFLALAAARLDPFAGGAVMTAFGLGTVPLMVATGVGSSFLSLAGRERLLRGAAWCVIITGLLTIYRGAGFLAAADRPDRPACPFCLEQATTREPTVP